MDRNETSFQESRLPMATTAPSVTSQVRFITTHLYSHNIHEKKRKLDHARFNPVTGNHARRFPIWMGAP